MALSFIDFCAGIGGGRLGLELNGFKCLAFSEIDKKATETYESFYNTSNELKLGDLTKINPSILPNFDLLISGFPCQSFSIVGKREGLLNKDKGQIIYYISNILKAKQPKYFILENVKGLLHHDNGRTLNIILDILDKSNYNTSYKLLNSIDFNLPQSRERVYFIGVRKDIGNTISFDFANDYFSIINILSDSQIYKSKENLPKLKLSEILTPSEENIFDNNSPSYNTFLNYLENKYNKGKVDLNHLLEIDFQILDTRQSDLRVYQDKVPTLRRNRQGIFYTFKNKLYKLSALEALKLQGFYKLNNLENILSSLLRKKIVKDNDILKQCGNAMSVNVIESIGKEIMRLEYAMQ